MATPKLQASTDFFKKLSHEFQELKLMLTMLDTFVQRALVRACELKDERLLIILNQLEIFITMITHLSKRLEALLFMLVITD